jgi:PIN domain nuclease of toxin-antitoxin system
MRLLLDTHVLREPFDRLLIAQAYQEGLTLVMHDPKFSVYFVPLFW